MKNKLKLATLLTMLLVTAPMFAQVKGRAAPSLSTVSDQWNHTLRSSAFVKSGLESFHQHYQYQPIGLGGTALRVDPWGFAGTRAPNALEEIDRHKHRPYYGYEYWWDNEGHRFNPFILKGGYGSELVPGTITSFSQRLDITTGELNIELGLKVDEKSFTTKRTVFVTPDGVLVIRVQDRGAPSPVRFNVAVEQEVRINKNNGVYNRKHEPWKGDFTAKEEAGMKGTVVTATRSNTSTASLGVVVETVSPAIVSDKNASLSAEKANEVVTFYIAPASSFNPATSSNPWDHAWNQACAARQKGYEALKRETAAWWNDYMKQSQISIPDETIAKLYARSIFYHGVYFGNTKIPPGCNATEVEGFSGAICPEYDLVYSQFALVYTGRLNEAKNVADWTYFVLPKAKEYAVKGITHHKVTRKYESGAIYNTLMGYDGALCIRPTEKEGRILYHNYPGANAALMALLYLDYSNDPAFRDKAYDILKSTTYISLQDLKEVKGVFFNKNKPNIVQQAATRMQYNECKKRGIAEPAWRKYDDKILIPDATLSGETQFVGGVNVKVGVAAATYLTPLWYHGVVDKSDPRVLATYNNIAYQQEITNSKLFAPYNEIAKTNVIRYVFNNGVLGVIAAKLGLGNQALAWLRNFELPDIYYDDVCFSEVKGKFALSPEIGAHGAYICNVSQMLVDPDDDRRIDLFPAIPDAWDFKEIAFSNLMAKGGLSISALRDAKQVQVEVKNTSPETIQREMRIKIPEKSVVAKSGSATFSDGCIVLQLTIPPGKTQRYEYNYSSSAISSKTR